MLLFNPGKLVAFEGDLLRKKPVNPYSSSFGHLLPLIERVCALASEEGTVKHETAMSYLCAIVGELLCTMPLCDVEEVSENMIKPILLYCSDHFADEDISIAFAFAYREAKRDRRPLIVLGSLYTYGDIYHALESIREEEMKNERKLCH